LTAAGQDVFDTARDLEDIVLGLERRVHGRDARLAGPVRVTLPDPLLAPLLPLFRQFTRAHPDIALTLAIDTGYADLAHREADIAIRAAAEPPSELVGRRIATIGVGVYGSREYLKGRPPRDLSSLDWIGWEQGSAMTFARWIHENVPGERIALRVNHGWALRDAIDEGFGVSLLPCAAGDKMRTWQRVRREPALTAPLWVLTHKDLRTTARVRVLRDFLSDSISAERKTYEGK
ncbi:MAG TPA: LysR substrate-binding domain-containing protein, partial [Polyangiaceae bacterium]|nr:LysR substrate-binding domain-containing protein [Polyangiaceae bacterium]